MEEEEEEEESSSDDDGEEESTNPKDVDLLERLNAFVDDQIKSVARKNAIKMCESKGKECKEHCELVHPKDKCKHIISTSEPFCTAFRDQCPRGGGRPSKKRQRQINKHNKKQKSAFDLKVCNEIMDVFKLRKSPAFKFPHPKKPLAWRGFDQCKAVIKRAHTEQLTRGVINKSWEVTWSNALKKLQRHVKDREPAIRKAQFAEKQNSEFSPCANVALCDDVETELHNDTSEAGNKRVPHVQLRLRFCLLFLVLGVL